MSRPEPRPSTLSSRAQRTHPAIPREARDDAPTTGTTATPSGGGTQQQVNFRADAVLVRKAKAQLALEGRTMQDLLTGALHDYIRSSSPDTAS